MQKLRVPSGLLGATAEARGPGDVEGSAWGVCEGQGRGGGRPNKPGRHMN